MRRYLVSFRPKSYPHFFTDVLIVGSGLAGLRAALAVDPKLDVLLVCKASVNQSSSYNAQGGIASVWAETDSFESHIADTLEAGGELCDREVVNRVVRQGPDAVRELIQFGTLFDRSGEKIALGREGGHAHDRIIHALGDGTGREIVRALVEEVRRRPNIRIWENTFIIDFLTTEGKCRGALLNWKKENRLELVWAKQTILASGGIGQLFRETTNPEGATGDGIAAAFRAGAEIRDMEFVQFHPTVLYIAGGARCLISEATRGEGARLVDKNGHRFMPEYDSRGELAPRDVVSRAIILQMIKTNYPNVLLDLTHLEPDMVHQRFPGIAKECRKFGIDIARERIPVRPGTHYLMGGITVNDKGESTVPGLWVAGESASTGLHGANRLASNSLLEALVYGESCGRLAGEIAKNSQDEYRVQPILDYFEKVLYTSEGGREQGDKIDIDDITNSLKSTMWRNAGILRNAEQLSEAAESCQRLSSYVMEREFRNIKGWELQNMLMVAQLILQGAMLRRETRGAHNREDFPQSDPALAKYHFSFTNPLLT
ncbi:MAG: L-aspartate oxidase [Thermoguttaceae bacterium]